MTDTLDLSIVKNEPGRNGTAPVSACVTCGVALPAKGEANYHVQRKYCLEHAPASSTGAQKRKKGVSPNPDEPAPRSVTNNFEVKLTGKGSRLSGDSKLVEEGAADMLALVPMILAAFGDDTCPEVLKQAIPDIARQLGILAKYHPSLKKIFAAGESTGEFMAWVGLVVTLSPVVIAILAHHNLLSGKAAERAAYAASMGGLLANVVAEATPDEEPVDASAVA